MTKKGLALYVFALSLLLITTCSCCKTTGDAVMAIDDVSDANSLSDGFIYAEFRNPIVRSAADPFVTEHNGNYYYCYAVPGGVAVNLMKGITDIRKEGAVVWTAPAGTDYSSEYWAPELHYIENSWYIYVAADDGNNVNHRMYVLKRENENPVGKFELVGKITDETNKWAIDGTVLKYGGELYFVWSGWEGDVNVAQNIYIAHMSDPCTIDGPRSKLSGPDYNWEKIGRPFVNEGPAVLYHEESLFIVYSASGSWTDDYCLGILKYSGGDPVDPDSWVKSDIPVFEKAPGVAYGPGHCSFVFGVDGTTLMYYHANPESGTGWGGRAGWIAPVIWDENGNPSFGKPQQTVRLAYGRSDEN